MGCSKPAHAIAQPACDTLRVWSMVTLVMTATVVLCITGTDACSWMLGHSEYHRPDFLGCTGVWDARS